MMKTLPYSYHKPRWLNLKFLRGMLSLSRVRSVNKHLSLPWLITNLKKRKSEWTKLSEKTLELDWAMSSKLELLDKFPTWPKFTSFLWKIQSKVLQETWRKLTWFHILRMLIDQLKKETYLLSEETLSQLNSKSLLQNQRNSVLLPQTQYFLLKETLSTDRINKNLTRSDMTILEVVENKWL